MQKDVLSKLKKEKELLMQEALQIEANLNQQWEKQRKTISELQESINKFRKKTLKSVTTQTSPTKTASEATNTDTTREDNLHTDSRNAELEENSKSNCDMFTQTDGCSINKSINIDNHRQRNTIREKYFPHCIKWKSLQIVFCDHRPIHEKQII